MSERMHCDVCDEVIPEEAAHMRLSPARVTDNKIHEAQDFDFCILCVRTRPQDVLKAMAEEIDLEL